MSNIRMNQISALAAAACLAVSAQAGAAPQQITAAGYAVLHNFTKSDGKNPWGELVQSKNGTFYGTNYEGGDSDAGTVFSMSLKGTVKALHTFVTTDGIAPATGLTYGKDGNLYGLTAGGGAYGYGTAFMVTNDGSTFKLLHSFGGMANDGSYPYLGKMALGNDGNLYGTTMQGGSANMGTVFQLTPAGVVTVLHTFTGGKNDGASPRGGLTLGSDGRFYGTTLCGGVDTTTKGCGGLIFKISPKGAFNVVHNFNPTDNPQSRPIEANGFFYGTTTAGGTNNAGQVYKMAIDGTGYTVLHSFAPGTLGKLKGDGGAPTGPLLLATDGNLYGTTTNGGANTSVDPNGDGTIFRITPAGVLTIIQTFGASADDGARPIGGVSQGADGLLYGLTLNGASQSDGTVYKLQLPTN